LSFFISNTTESEHSEHTVEENTYTHFSTIALAARDGTTRWHHLPGEFGEEETKKEVIIHSQAYLSQLAVLLIFRDTTYSSKPSIVYLNNMYRFTMPM